MAVLAALSDWLLYGETLGISAALFCLCVWAGMAVCRPIGTIGNLLQSTVILFICLLPCVAQMTAMAICFALAGTAFVSVSTGLEDAPIWRRAMLVPIMLRGVFWRILMESWSALEVWTVSPFGEWKLTSWFVWVLPVTLGLVFVTLFAQANPVIAIGIADLNPALLGNAVPWGHWWFWVLTAGFLWPFLAPAHFQIKDKRAGALPTEVRQRSAAWAILFGKAAVLRSLVVFNVMFAVQTGMDFCYLWGGAKLPAGLTFADYAHQGAYPLIITALLAGGFCIVATKPESDAAKSRLVQNLGLLWILQNMLLVGSAIWRLKLYVDMYELTELRLAALIWMVLVAVGLILILARMTLKRSNIWLVRANVVALTATLYACSFANFANVVSMYDVKHCFELSGRGQHLDVDYVSSLGPQAIPALDLYQVHTAKPGPGKPFVFLSTGTVGQPRSFLRTSRAGAVGISGTGT